MTKIRNIIPIAALTLFASVLLTSCTAERKTAKQFLQNRKNTSVLIIPADFIYKRNLKAWQVADDGWMDDASRDSVLYMRSSFMQFVSDSIFLETYQNSLINSLRSKGLSVYLQADIDLFLQSPNKKYIINVAQLMLEETEELLFDPDYDIEYNYLGEFYLNMVLLSSWFEISGVNEPEPKKAVAFAEMNLTDQFEGRFRFFPFTGGTIYTYSVDTVKLDDIYAMAQSAGYRYSGYIFDYLMNRYVDRNLPPNKTRTSYFRYDFSTRLLKQAMEERFVFIE